jgi:REP element-mobilizing transposase RayT
MFALRAQCGRDVRAPSKNAPMTSIKAALQKELQQAGWHSRGYLPHFDGGEIAQTITLHLGDSLPQAVLERWRREFSAESATKADAVLRRRIEYYLDQGYGGCSLKDVRVATMVQESLLHFDGERYWLSGWVVMPNHIHLLLTPDAQWSLSKIMKSFKSYTSHEANKILRLHGRFWLEDYFDRYVRDEKHFASAIAYIENNPVKARLCGKPEDWPFSSAWFRAQRNS